MKKLLLFCFALTLPFFAIGQQEEIKEDLTIEKDNKWEASLMVGLSSYEGDLHCFEDDELGAISNANFAFGIAVKRQLNNKVAAGLSYRRAKLSGDDAKFTQASGHPTRGYNFTNNINELTVRVDFTPFGDKDWKVQPYIYAGIGLAMGGSETNFMDSGIDSPVVDALVMQDMEDLSSSSTTAPIGIGFKANLTDKITIGLEGGLRFLNNDYLDGVSQSGNSDVNDFYGVGGVVVGYKF